MWLIWGDENYTAKIDAVVFNESNWWNPSLYFPFKIRYDFSICYIFLLAISVIRFVDTRMGTLQMIIVNDIHPCAHSAINNTYRSATGIPV